MSLHNFCYASVTSFLIGVMLFSSYHALMYVGNLVIRCIVLMVHMNVNKLNTSSCIVAVC